MNSWREATRFWPVRGGHRRRRPGSGVLLAVALALLGPAGAHAQQDASTETAPASGEAVPPARIPAAEIPIRFEAASSHLREILALLPPDPRVEQIRADLSEAADEVRQLKEAHGLARPEDLSFRQLHNLRHSWRSLRSRLQGWTAVLARRSAQLQEQRTALKQLETTWTTTQTAVDDDATRALGEQAARVLASIDEVRGQVRTRLAVVLTLLNDVSVSVTAAGEALTRIDMAEGQIRQRLFAPDRPPLWHMLVAPMGDRSLSEQVHQTWENNSSTMRSFFARDGDRVVGQLAVFFGLWISLLVLRQRSRGWQIEDESIEAAGHILDRPVAAALLITLMLTRAFHPGAPPLVYEWNRILFVVPVATLLPVLLAGRMRRPLYGVVALFLLDQVDNVALQVSLLQRVIVLAVTGMALAGLVHWLRRNGPDDLGSAKWARAVRVIARLAVILLAGSLLANILGAVALAELVTEGVLTSAVFALGSFAGVIVLSGIFTLVLHT